MVVVCYLPSWATQEVDCAQVSALARMARSRSVGSLAAEKARAGDSYRAQLVFAFRSLQLVANGKNAERLLALIPKDDSQQTIVMTLGDYLCTEEPNVDTLILSRVNEGLARELAKAVLLAPRYLSAYVTYSMVAVSDPHSDYAPRMAKVCQQRHAQFIETVKQLPLKQRQEFTKYVIEPNSCRAIAMPEAD